MANGYDFTRFRGIRPAQGAGLLTGLLEGATARGQQQYQQQQYQDALARQQQQDQLSAVKAGIDPNRLGDQEYIAQIAQQRLDRANRPLGTSEIERLAFASQDESLPQNIRDAYLARIQTLSKDPRALFAQSQQSELGKLQAQQQIKPSLEQDVAMSREIGKGMAEKELQAPKSIQQTDQLLTAIDDTLSDTEGLEQSVGGVGGLLGRQAEAFPVTAGQRRFIPRLEQLKGKAFLQAFESLKGGGQITEIEGKKASDAIARLNTVQDPQDFVKSLQELREIVLSARARLQGGQPQAQQPTMMQQPMQQQMMQPAVQDNNDPLGLR